MARVALLLLGVVFLASAVPSSFNTTAVPSSFNTTRAAWPNATASSFNESKAVLFAKYCGASYCCGTLGHGVAHWDCAACQQLPWLQTTVVYSKGTNTNGYVGYNAVDNQIIVAFAGTDPLSVKDWINDIDIIKEAYPCPGCRVHEGFHRAYVVVADAVRAAVGAVLAAHPTASLHVTGHSMGAAIATHAALDLAARGCSVREVYTFGQPRVGNKAFAAHVKSTLPSFFRVTHGFDPVPHLPLHLPLGTGFHHVATEVYYNERQTAHRVCDGSGEDLRCSRKHVVSLSVLDHIDYMHFNFVSNFLLCKL